MLRGAILLFFCVIGNSNEDGDWLKCKPKPGCSIARCDPPPGHWLENLDKLDDYSILCQKNETSEDAGMVTNYADVLEELAKLKGRLERSEREGSEMKVEINILERETIGMKIQMEEKRNESESTINNALKKINILERENTRLKTQMEEMESRTEKERNESESTLKNALKNLEKKIERKFTSWRMEAEDNRRSVKPWIEKRNVSCASTFNGICYWTYVQEEWNVTFARAEEICSNKASTPAHFPSEEVYNSVVDHLRSKTSPKNDRFNIWTGITIDTNTGKVIHPSGDTYVKWNSGHPVTGSSFKTRTHVAFNVKSVFGSPNQGMFNYIPQRGFHGVVCQSVSSIHAPL